MPLSAPTGARESLQGLQFAWRILFFWSRAVRPIFLLASYPLRALYVQGYMGALVGFPWKSVIVRHEDVLTRPADVIVALSDLGLPRRQSFELSCLRPQSLPTVPAREVAASARRLRLLLGYRCGFS